MLCGIDSFTVHVCGLWWFLSQVLPLSGCNLLFSVALSPFMPGKHNKSTIHRLFFWVYMLVLSNRGDYLPTITRNVCMCGVIRPLTGVHAVHVDVHSA